MGNEKHLCSLTFTMETWNYEIEDAHKLICRYKTSKQLTTLECCPHPLNNLRAERRKSLFIYSSREVVTKSTSYVVDCVSFAIVLYITTNYLLAMTQFRKKKTTNSNKDSMYECFYSFNESMTSENQVSKMEVISN